MEPVPLGRIVRSPLGGAGVNGFDVGSSSVSRISSRSYETPEDEVVEEEVEVEEEEEEEMEIIEDCESIAISREYLLRGYYFKEEIQRTSIILKTSFPIRKIP